MLVRSVDDVFVDFVSDDVDVIFDGEVGDNLKFLLCENLAAGIRRVANENRLYAFGGDCFFKDIYVEFELGRNQRNIDGLCAAKNSVSDVVFEEGRKEHYFVAGIRAGHHGCHHGFGTAAGDHHVLHGVDMLTGKVALLFSQCFTEIGRTPGDCILVRTFVSNRF